MSAEVANHTDTSDIVERLLTARVWRPSMDSTDYHNFSKQYQAAITRLWKAKIPEDDKKLIEKFARDSKTQGCGLARLTKLVRNLAVLGELMNVPFKQATTEDIRRVVHHFEMSDYSVWCKHDVKVILKQFYKWLDGEDYPKCVKWICTTVAKKDLPLTTEAELLTEDEINKVIACADHPRNKALLAVLAESGARIAEIGNLTIGQVNVDSNGTVLNVSGKTGRRRLRIVSATPYLLRWLDAHPEKDNSYAPLWINHGTLRYHKQMTYDGIRVMIQDTFKRAGIKKRCHPYIFRHSRASQMARHLTEFQMCSYFGWMQGSTMPGLYVHISGKDLDEDILRMNGLRPGQPVLPFKPQVRMCPRCKEVNTPNALYCCKCAEICDPSLALKTKLAESQRHVEMVKTPFLEWVENDPELRDLLKRKSVEFKDAILTTQQ